MTIVFSSRQIPNARNTTPTDSNSTVIHLEFKNFFALNLIPPGFLLPQYSGRIRFQ